MKIVQSPSRRQLMAAAGAGLVPNSLALWLTSPKQVRALYTKQGQDNMATYDSRAGNALGPPNQRLNHAP